VLASPATQAARTAPPHQRTLEKKKKKKASQVSEFVLLLVYQ
jgi:hypothetical protein